MPRPKRKSPSKTISKFSGAWALMLVDNEPIRRQALEDYRAGEKNLLRSRGEIEAFETRDLPAFHRWEASLFGVLLLDRTRPVLGNPRQPGRSVGRNGPEAEEPKVPG